MKTSSIYCSNCGVADAKFFGVCQECYDKIDSFTCQVCGKQMSYRGICHECAAKPNVSAPKKPYHSVRTFEGELGKLWLWHTGRSAINDSWRNTKIYFDYPDQRARAGEPAQDDWTFWFERTGAGVENGRIGPFQKSEIKEVTYEMNAERCTWGECYHIVIVLSSGVIELDYIPPFRIHSNLRGFENIRRREEFSYFRGLSKSQIFQ
jgi:hypothetical protein